MTKHLVTRLARRMALALAEGEAVQEQTTADNLRRVRLGALLLLPVLGLTALWILVWSAPAAGAMPLWQKAVGMTHLSALCTALVACLLAHGLLRHAPHGLWARCFLQTAAALTLLAGLVLTLFYQWVSPKVTPLMLTALTVAMMFHLRPATSALLFIGTSVLGFVALPWTQPDPALLASSRASAIVIPLTALVFSVLHWRRNTISILLSRSLAQANAQLVAKQAELERLAWYDGLTGLCRRSEFMRRADHELLRALRYGHATAFVLLDIDHFKQVNDTHGHPAGDAVLRQLGQALQLAVRTSDLVARMGGEEFIVMLPETTLADALDCAEKLRHHAAHTPMATPAGMLHITISLGVVEVPPQARADMGLAYAAADRALYRAKASGRNRVAASTLEDETMPGSEHFAGTLPMPL